MKKGLIIGKGWLGNRLEAILDQKYVLTTTKRNADQPNCISIDFDQIIDKSISTTAYEFIVITIPLGKRQSIEELDFRFTQLIQFIGEFNKQILLISSTGIYPDEGDVINETTFSDCELNQSYQLIENKLKITYPQLVILRLGGLMGDNRYLSNYIKLDKPNLDVVANHIHYQDVCTIIDTIIEQNFKGKIYNAVAPENPTKEEILEYQINQNLIKSTSKKGKIISSDKLINELNYQFIFPNPIYFK
ncbi:hypothetical protein SAMN05443634_1097 [Chishuiella changwenlii]|uniref:NAD(P)-dependent oxidoreductase n=1 Tax=Chishuiella changwenlii TaxID=1434701 RepID=A0A1M7AF66_9FLAO|nr:hypothetical protein [Chishuiella changwenlii]GGE90136.1 NAD(P)-dependent oxidoreductase [Chishuiella changwenlii]SHL41382.1 hypothetical protein SAMN05443634_1097 [Chishuiella changwenlii]